MRSLLSDRDRLAGDGQAGGMNRLAAMRSLLRLGRSFRRWLLVAGLRLQAAAKGAKVEFSAAPDLVLGRDVRILVESRSRNRIVAGPGCRIEDGVRILMRGGTLLLGPGASIRRGSVLKVSGELELEGENVIGYYNVVHCAERIVLGRHSFLTEFVTIVDSRHFHDAAHSPIHHNVQTAPIRIGRNVWVCAKASVLMGVTIGDEAVVAAHAVVKDDVPAGSVVAGIPAQVVRQR
ncbi:MAG: acyltransferase [Actinomycetota bacterium]